MNRAVTPALDRTPYATLAEEAEQLIKAYPHNNADEIERLVEIFPKLPVLDVGLMTSDEALAGKLEAFHRDHGHKIRMPLPHVVLLLSAPVILLLVVLWAMFLL